MENGIISAPTSLQSTVEKSVGSVIPPLSNDTEKSPLNSIPSHRGISSDKENSGKDQRTPPFLQPAASPSPMANNQISDPHIETRMNPIAVTASTVSYTAPTQQPQQGTGNAVSGSTTTTTTTCGATRPESAPTNTSVPILTSESNALSAGDTTRMTQDSSSSPTIPAKPVDMPCLRGKLTAKDDGSQVIDGVWGMTVMAHSMPGQTSAFQLKLAPPKQNNPSEQVGPSSGIHNGWFMLQQAGGKSPLRVEEKQVRITFTKSEGDGNFVVHGNGKNRFGEFIFEGTLKDANFEAFKQYKAKSENSRKRPSAPKSTVRTQRQKNGGLANSDHSDVGGKTLKGLSQTIGDVATTPAGRAQRSSRGDWKDKADMPIKRQLSSTPASTSVKPKSGSRGRSTSGKSASNELQQTNNGTFQQSALASLPASLADGTQSKAGRIRRLPSHLQDQEEIKPVRLNEHMRKCVQLLRHMMTSPKAYYFNEPVDPIKLHLPDYFQVIRNPMDFSTIKVNIERGTVGTPEEFKSAMLLVFDNAMLYNTKQEHDVHAAARSLKSTFQQKYRTQVEEPMRRAAAAVASASQTDDSLGTQSNTSAKTQVSAKSKKTVSSAKSVSTGRQLKTSKAKAGPRNPSPSTTASSSRSVSITQSSRNSVSIPEQQMIEMRRQMQQMQETINRLQRQTSQTEVHVRSQVMNSSKSSTNARRTASDDHKPLTEDEKVKLSNSISSLPAEKQSRVLDIIKERTANVDDDGQEIEIDINALDTPTLRHLQRYVKSCRSSKKRKQPKKSISPVLASEQLDLDIHSLENHELFGLDPKRPRLDTDIALDLPFDHSDLVDGLDSDSEPEMA